MMRNLSRTDALLTIIIVLLGLISVELGLLQKTVHEFSRTFIANMGHL
jgi:hypothetical protein